MIYFLYVALPNIEIVLSTANFLKVDFDFIEFDLSPSNKNQLWWLEVRFYFEYPLEFS